MRWPRIALGLVAHGDCLGAREELIGDVLEEIARGRSHWWVCQQLIGLYGFAFTKYMRTRLRLTPQIVAFALGVLLFTGMAIGSVSRVLEAWLAFYYVTGTLSLFAHMASRTVRAGATGISAPVETPNVTG